MGPREARRSQGCARDGSAGVAEVVAAAPRHRGWAVRFLLRPLPGPAGGFCSIRSCLTACRRRVVALMVQFPPRATAWWLWVAPRAPRPCPPGPRAPRPCPPGPHAPGPPAHAPRPPCPRVAHPGACGTRSTLLSVVFQAFARNSVRPLHLGALSCKWPLDVGVRHAQAPAIKCDA